jgi:OFA family oxalate/formate antiporter-like MFS transporter
MIMKKFLLGSLGGVILLLCVRAATMAIAPLNIAFMRFLGVSDTLAPTISGTILFVGYVFAIFGPMFGGWITDKVGTRNSILIGGFLFTAAYFLWAYAADYPLLYVYRALLALGSGAVAVGMMSFLHETAPEGKKGAGMGLYGLGFGLGSALGPVVAARLAPTGIREPFMFFSFALLVSIGLALLLMLVAKRLFSTASNAEFNVQASNQKEKQTEINGIKIFNRSLYLLFILSMCYMFGTIAIITTADDFGVQVLGLEAGKGLMAVVSYSVASLLQPLGGMIGDKIGKERATMIGVGIAAVCLLGVALNTFSFALQIILMALTGLGGVLYMPNVMALIGDISPAEAKGKALGFFQGAAGLGSALGALLAGVIYSAMSVRAAFWLAPIGTIIGFVCITAVVSQMKKPVLAEA